MYNPSGIYSYHIVKNKWSKHITIETDWNFTMNGLLVGFEKDNSTFIFPLSNKKQQQFWKKKLKLI